tara:strand:- start:3298 stop:5943 length:2646 start_codon:yes stop_codon:yes gene_type:complete
MTAKYKRSFKGGSFRPQQVSKQDESRLQEHANRVIQGLREERDAVISNRNRIADAMKENAQIESQQASANNAILQQNLQSQLDDVKAQNAAAQRQFETDVAAQEAIFGSIAKLSSTAAEKLNEIEVERRKEKQKGEFAQTLALGDNDPNVQFLKALIKDATAKQVEGYVLLAAAAENGADELDVSEQGRKFKELGYGAKRATWYKLGKGYPEYLQQQLMDETTEYQDSEGNTFTGAQASRNAERTGIVVSHALQTYLAVSNQLGTKSALLQESGFLDMAMKANQHAITTARKHNIDDNNFRADSDLNFQLANASSPADAKLILETEWIDLTTRKGLEGAHNYLTELHKTVDEDGKPVYHQSALFAAELGPNGEKWGDRWKNRREEIQINLANARDTAFRKQEQRDQNNAIQDFRLRSDDLNEQLFTANARDDLDIIATAKKAYSDKYNGFVPPQLLNLERKVLAENKEEAEQKLEVVTQRARDGLLTQGEVLSIQDPTMRSQAQTLLVEQNKIRRFGKDYEGTLKSLAQDAKQIVKNPLNAPGGETSKELQLFMENQFAAWYKEGLAQSNDDPTAALAYARQNHRAEFAKSMAGADDGLYVRKYDDNNGSVFPNIQAAKRRTAAVIDQNIARIRNQIGATGIGALDSPNLVSSAPKLRNLSLIHYTGGSINELITPEIKETARLLGVSEIEVINRQIDAFNKYNTDKIEPIRSPALDLVNDARPETQRLFTDDPTTRSVARGAAEVTPDMLLTAQAIRPSMRPFITGNTGIGTGPHSDFRVWDVERGQYIDPTPFLGRLTVNGKPLTEQFRMTSPYGMRTHPVTGEYKMHHGVDFATPIGTKVDVDGEYLETINDPTAGNMGIYPFDQDGRKYEIHGLHGN